MHMRTKVKDLSLIQWDYLTTKVPVNGRTFIPGVPRVCVEFELTADFSSLHIEMDVTELAGLLVTLAAMDLRRVAEAALTPDNLSGLLESVRSAADPARGPATMPVSYEDGDATYDGRA